MDTAAIQFDGRHPGDLWHQCRGFRGDDVGWRFNARQSVGARSCTLGSELRAAHRKRAMVAVADFRVYSRWLASHSLQYVVPVGSRQISRIGLVALDILRGL